MSVYLRFLPFFIGLLIMTSCGDQTVFVQPVSAPVDGKKNSDPKSTDRTQDDDSGGVAPESSPWSPAGGRSQLIRRNRIVCRSDRNTLALLNSELDVRFDEEWTYHMSYEAFTEEMGAPFVLDTNKESSRVLVSQPEGVFVYDFLRTQSKTRSVVGISWPLSVPVRAREVFTQFVRRPFSASGNQKWILAPEGEVPIDEDQDGVSDRKDVLPNYQFRSALPPYSVVLSTSVNAQNVLNPRPSLWDIHSFVAEAWTKEGGINPVWIRANGDRVVSKGVPNFQPTQKRVGAKFKDPETLVWLEWMDSTHSPKLGVWKVAEEGIQIRNIVLPRIQNLAPEFAFLGEEIYLIDDHGLLVASFDQEGNLEFHPSLSFSKEQQDAIASSRKKSSPLERPFVVGGLQVGAFQEALFFHLPYERTFSALYQWKRGEMKRLTHGDCEEASFATEVFRWAD